ncbi:ABC-type nitrate/sulfonate/bicarbonate transport system, substrate-binding protein [Vibrio xiamenensis]|uniref:ABC-type nitrate/sulfonate/bicarbonate transport system, substrate-binding protein n=1 Tax=Vibrio xiamenensis TaxID=861298 RepID=A0A1G7ZRQ9_9VIBR|nr:ABC-type nitrate/sulfonate/bicarbonate transport system, substrate-binding protein [Vibrio xiamenensis]
MVDKRKLTLLFIAALCVFALAVLFKSIRTTPAIIGHPVTIAVSQTPLSAPFLVAWEKRMFSLRGVDVTLNNCMGGVACAQMLFDGKADFATASESVVMFESFHHPDIRLIASFVESDNDLKLLALSTQNIDGLKDLKGKRVGVVEASASEFYLDSLLIANNMAHLDYIKVYMPPQQLVEALFSYQVDAISVWEPFGYKTTISSAADIHNLGLQGIYQLTFNLISRAHIANQREQESEQILLALNDAIAWIKQNPDDAQALVAQYLNVPSSQLKWSWNDYLFRLSLGNALLSNLQLQARWASEKGLVAGQMPDYRVIFSPTPLEQALNTRVQIR